MSARRPEEGQRFHTELAVNILRKNVAEQTVQNPPTKFPKPQTLDFFCQKTFG